MFDSIRQQFFPAELIPGITAQPEMDSARFWATFEPLDKAIFAPFAEQGAYKMLDDRWQRSSTLGQAFAQAHHEYMLFYNERDEPIGFSFGWQRDRISYFMTGTGILPAYQRRGIYSTFLKRFLSYLNALGYERVVSNHQTNNRAVLIAKLKAGFNVTAVNLDERWGAQVELTYLFYEDRQRGYERAFALEHRQRHEIQG